MQEKEDQPRQTAYSYSQQAFTGAALAPGQYSIGTGGQDWIGSNKQWTAFGQGELLVFEQGRRVPV